MQNEILIVNYRNNQLIDHEVILVKGLLNRGTKCCSKIGKKVLKVCLNDGGNKDCLLDQQNNVFKCLLVLKEGANCIRFTCCCIKKELKLIYQDTPSEKNVQAVLLISRFERNLSVDEQFLESATNQILLGLRLLQCFLAEKLDENGRKRKTFYLRPKCVIFLSNFNFYELLNYCTENGQNIWNLIAKELLNNFPNFAANSKFIVFLFTNYKIVRKIEQPDFYKIAIGGGGLALFSFDYLFTWPQRFSQVFVKFADQSLLNNGYHLGDYFSKSLGAVCHEICHTFDLGHNSRGIMSNEFHNLSCFFTFLHFHECFDCDFDDLRNKIVIRKQRNCYDCVYMEKSNCTILSYHKWFNKKCGTSTIKYDKTNQSLFSESGLRVIEIRNNDNGNVLKSWEFVSKILKFYFQIPNDFCVQLDSQRTVNEYLLFVQDSNGVIKKILI